MDNPYNSKISKVEVNTNFQIASLRCCIISCKLENACLMILSSIYYYCLVSAIKTNDSIKEEVYIVTSKISEGYKMLTYPAGAQLHTQMYKI